MPERRVRVGASCLVATLLIVSWAAIDAQEPGPLPEATEESVDVTRFGAVADGVTDSTRAIQAAIDAAASLGGGRVLFPPASAPYVVSDTIRISSSNIELVGRGAELRLADDAVGGRASPMVLVEGTNEHPVRQVVIGGLAVDANYFAQSNARGSKAVVVRFAEDSRIEDVEIRRAYVGVSVRRSFDIEVRRVTVSDYAEDAFDAGGDADLVSGGLAARISFVDVVARDAPRAADDGNAFEIEDGVETILIEDGLVENVAGNGVGMRNHDTADHINHSRDVELRRVTLRGIGGAYAVFASARPAVERQWNSYGHVRLVDMYADGLCAFWGPVGGVELTGGRYDTIHIGLDAAGKPVSDPVDRAVLADLDAASIRINAEGASRSASTARSTGSLTGLPAASRPI